MAIHLLLHNIRSAHNVGAIFRSADAFGVEHIWCTGYTPTPVDRHGRARNDVAKASLGAEQRVPYSSYTRPQSVIQQVRGRGFAVTAVEQDPAAMSLRQWMPPRHVCLVLGNEVHGVSRSLRARVDGVVEISILGTKESLNVSVAAGVVLHHCVAISIGL